MQNQKLLKPVLLVAILAIIGVTIWLTNSPKSDQAQEQTQTAQVSEGAPMVNVTIPANLSPEAQAGAQKFQQFCASCHGPLADGREGFGPPLVHKIYEPSHHGDAAFLLAPMQGVRAHHWSFGDMPPVEGVTERDLILITEYVRELQRANGIE